MNNPTKILIVGTGAIGGYFGGRLSQNPGNEVFFLARGKNLSNLKKNGLIIKSINGNAKLVINVSDNPEKFRTNFDLILISVKSYDTANIIKQIKKVVNKNTIVLSLQNGIDNYKKLIKAFGKSRVLQGICRIAVEMTGNSVISHTALGIIVIGEEDKKKSARINNLNNIFTESDIKCKISEDIIKDIWVKYGWNCIFNTLTGITAITADKFFADAESEKIIYDFYNEFKKIAKSEGIILNKEDEIKIIDDTRKFTIFKTSTYQDRLKGKKLEFETFTGYLVKLADKNHIEVPIIRALHKIIRIVDLSVGSK